MTGNWLLVAGDWLLVAVVGCWLFDYGLWSMDYRLSTKKKGDEMKKTIMLLAMIACAASVVWAVTGHCAI